VRGSSSAFIGHLILLDSMHILTMVPSPEYDELKTVQITVLPKTICPTAPPAPQNAEPRRIFR
jgi:hypothetical protein